MAELQARAEAEERQETQRDEAEQEWVLSLAEPEVVGVWLAAVAELLVLVLADKPELDVVTPAARFALSAA